MEYIEEILAKCKKNNKSDVIAVILAGIFFFSTIPVIIIFFNGSKLLGLILFLGAFLMPTIGYILGMKLGNILFKPKKVKFNKTKLYKKLEKKGCLYEFINTINKEIDEENTIKYYDEIVGVGLLITETWFVFIDTMYPKFVKTSEIVKISDEIDHKSKSFMYLELKNSKFIRIDHLMCNDIENEIKTKYPDIEIGIEIIEK